MSPRGVSWHSHYQSVAAYSNVVESIAAWLKVSRRTPCRGVVESVAAYAATLSNTPRQQRRTRRDVFNCAAMFSNGLREIVLDELYLCEFFELYARVGLV